MRFSAILVLILLLTACSAKLSPVPTTAAELNREAELLIRASLSDRLVQATTDYYREQLSSLLIGQGLTPEEAETGVMTLMQPLIEPEHQRLVETLVPIYRRHYTADEIHQLLSFYQTEVARKSQRVSARIAGESQQYLRLWSENFGERLLERIDAGYGVGK